MEKSLVPPEGAAGDAAPESEIGQVVETTNEAVAGPAGDQQLQGEKVSDHEEKPVEKEKKQPPTEQVQAPTEAPTEQVQALTEPPTEQVQAPTDQPPTQEQPPVAEEESSSDNPESTASTEEPAVPQVETVVINNPARRPPTKYPVANAAEIHICTDPNSFPENCTLVIREGEPFDFLASRGLCSVLGMVRKSRQPNVVSNDCVLKFGPNLSSLSLEIIDNAFNTFRITGTKSMWIKLDLQYVYLN